VIADCPGNFFTDVRFIHGGGDISVIGHLNSHSGIVQQAGKDRFFRYAILHRTGRTLKYVLGLFLESQIKKINESRLCRHGCRLFVFILHRPSLEELFIGLVK
jgi:hypothetical protein